MCQYKWDDLKKKSVSGVRKLNLVQREYKIIFLTPLADILLF